VHTEPNSSLATPLVDTSPFLIEFLLSNATLIQIKALHAIATYAFKHPHRSWMALVVTEIRHIGVLVYQERG
jgi:hypothetical protein